MSWDYEGIANWLGAAGGGRGSLLGANSVIWNSRRKSPLLLIRRSVNLRQTRIVQLVLSYGSSYPGGHPRQL
jgi:hypothetical protein